MKLNLRIDVYIDIEVDEKVLTKELMDNYEKHFYALSEDSDYDKFETQLQKHTAHIAKWIARREHDEEIEGYGSLKNIVIDYDLENDFIYKD